MSNNRLHRDVVISTSGPVLVSTVDLARIEGANRSFVALIDSLDALGGRRALARYETMVFACNAEGEVECFTDLDCARTDDENAVEAQHAAMVAKWKAQASTVEALQHALDMELRAAVLQKQLEATQQAVKQRDEALRIARDRIGDLEDALDEAIGCARCTLLPGTDREAVLAKAEATLNGGVQ